MREEKSRKLYRECGNIQSATHLNMVHCNITRESDIGKTYNSKTFY